MAHRTDRASFLILASLVLPAFAPAAEAIETCPADARWGIVVDAGSSGSRLHYFCWRAAAEGGLPWIADLGSEKREPGIADADCTRTPAEAVDLLRPLVEQARETIGDPDRIARTPFSVLATGGLRQCPEGYQQAMLDAVGALLADTAFAPVEAAVITGQDEARFGWLTVNYLQDRLGSGAGAATLGALDLGGVSTQISFLPGECPMTRAECEPLALSGASYPLYAHSYLGWGQDEARRTVDAPACSLRGFPGEGFVGRGRFKACRRAIRRMIQREVRAHPPTPPCASSCTRLGAYQPPVRGDFVAFSAFAYTTDYFGLEDPLSLGQLAAAGKAICRTPWDEIQADCAAGRRNECDPDRLNRYCFAAAYIVTLLHDVYGFPMTSRQVTSTNVLDGVEIDWTLGVMVQMADGLSAPER